MKRVIPSVSLSSDFISGFCGETDSDHQDTLSLLRVSVLMIFARVLVRALCDCALQEVEYDIAFMFAYSMREKTFAHRTLVDDVPGEDGHFGGHLLCDDSGHNLFVFCWRSGDQATATE